jgi:hypothetical protein
MLSEEDMRGVVLKGVPALWKRGHGHAGFQLRGWSLEHHSWFLERLEEAEPADLKNQNNGNDSREHAIKKRNKL